MITLFKVIKHHPKATIEDMGLVPMMLSEHDPRSAKEQLDAGYQHGGGWHHFNGFELRSDDSIKYPGDPVLKPIIEIRFRDERIIMYPHAWFMVMEPDRSFEICRMD